MKKLIGFCLCLVAGSVMAQVSTETLTLKAVKKGEEPKEVMDAIKTDFPKAVVNDLSFLPAKLYGERWSVDVQDDLNGSTADLYQVNLREGKEAYTAAYDKNGNVISSKHIIDQAQLPAPVLKTVSSQYPGWKTVSDREKITYKKGSVKEAYYVRIQENNMFRNLFLDNNGKVIKDKLMARSK